MTNFQAYRFRPVYQKAPRKCQATKVNSYVHKAPPKSQTRTAGRVIRNGLNPGATPAPASVIVTVAVEPALVDTTVDDLDSALNHVYGMILETILELPDYPLQAPKEPSCAPKIDSAVIDEPEEFEEGYFLEEMFAIPVEPAQNQAVSAILIDEPVEFVDGYHLKELFARPKEEYDFGSTFNLKGLFALPKAEYDFGNTFSLRELFSLPKPEYDFGKSYHLNGMFSLPNSEYDFGKDYNLRELFCLPKPEYDFGESYNLDTLYHLPEEIIAPASCGSEVSDFSFVSSAFNAPSSSSSKVGRVKSKISLKIHRKPKASDPKGSWSSYFRSSRHRLANKAKRFLLLGKQV